ncbi:MAG: tyrosine-type recombinase/integrase [Isosphaeraceae bacterium]
MARPSKPWYWKARDAWFVNLHGKRHLLAKGKINRAKAYREYLRLSDLSKPEVASTPSAESICSLFLSHAKVHLKPKTVEGYAFFITPFSRRVRDTDAAAVQPKHVSEFLNTHPNWNQTTRYGAIKSIKRVWSWALAEGHITVNLLKPTKLPRQLRRDTIPDDKEMARFIAAANPAFRQLLIFMRETGCRPGEAVVMQKHHVDLVNREVRFKIGEDKTSGKTGRPRVIHLNDTALAMVRTLMTLYPAGPLLRNLRGKPWNKCSINCATRQARKKAGLGNSLAVAYAIRHQYITDALASGVPIAIVAEMTGTSPQMIAKVYSHISEKKTLFLEAANRVRPG